ncbi:MAG: cobalamin-dependent protein [Candidatus Lernaella stagnicola]|nr:cobalamin-dependent protein [Candidatus Lernaella stagnicola]
MKITLVAPASEVSRRVGRKPKGTSYFHYYKLGIATIAGATPPDIEVEAIDEIVDLWDPRTHETDAVGISVLTALAPRAYSIAAQFRERGIPVVLGGMHPTFLPAEAATHADAIVMGQGEFVWEQVCRDLQNNTLQPVYDSCTNPNEISVPRARREIFTNPKYPPLDIVQFSRGCIHKCRFCSVNAFFDGKYHWRPIDEVKAELATCTRKHLMVADDNLYGYREYCLEALAALAPLGKYLGIQATVDMAFDQEVMDAAAAAKVGAIFVGIESVVSESLAESAKWHNEVDKYADAMAEFHRRGIFVEGGLMFGFDHDEPDVFERTMKFVDNIRLDVAQVAFVTPMPGTVLFDRMQEEGRITDTNWAHYDCNHVVFRPTRMSALELMNGVEWFREKYYSLTEIARRARRGMRWFDPITLGTQIALNWGFRRNHELGLDYPP